MGRIWAAAVFGLAGFALLVGLGTWQVQRLAWKRGILADIEARIDAPPVALPDAPDARQDRYLPVRVAGRTTGEELRLLVSLPRIGAGYRIVAALDLGALPPPGSPGAVALPGGDLRQPMIDPLEVATPGAAMPGLGATGDPALSRRRIMVDLGFVRVEDTTARNPARLDVIGNLHWPDEVDGFTPDPDVEADIWFARDVPAMADALGTEPVLVVARSVDPGQGTQPLPVGTEGIPDDHLNYAITWFTLAAIWAGMTTLLIRRMARAGRTGGPA